MLNFDHSVSNEILFKNSTYSNQKFLSRCFRINFELQEIRYRTIMPLVRLEFYLDTIYKELFLINKYQNFTSGIVNFRGIFSQQKVTKKILKKSKKSNCKDYSNLSKLLKELACDSRRNCLDRCLTIRFT